jgi:hypothetical protein
MIPCRKRACSCPSLLDFWLSGLCYLLDANKDGIVDFREFIVGISQFLKGDLLAG